MRGKRDKGFCDKRDRDDVQEMREKRDKMGRGQEGFSCRALQVRAKKYLGKRTRDERHKGRMTRYKR
jgi:hypothetical protein